jgi:hypothetical protein
MAVMTTPLGVGVSAGRPVSVAARVAEAGVTVVVAAAVAVLMGGVVAARVDVPVGEAVPLVLMLMLTFPRLQATTANMIAEIPIRNVFVRMVFI